MQIDLTNGEMWKILDAIKSYTNDYSVSAPVKKIFVNIEKKLTKNLKASNCK
jgi:sulfur relay (sulfurtransferase) DsrC/TusE family protein